MSEDLECAVCFNLLNDPITLPSCKHTFCRLCLLKATRLSPDGRSCPLCRALIEIPSLKDHAVDAELEAALRSAVGDAEYDERREQNQREVDELNKIVDSQLPIFAMTPGTRVGGHVALHLFEPRYKILIRRAWEGNRLFVYCGCRPHPGAPGVVVRVDHATFLPDGRANIVGRGVEAVTLSDTWVEGGTGGLFHTTVHTTAALQQHASPRSGQEVQSSTPPDETARCCALM